VLVLWRNISPVVKHIDSVHARVVYRYVSTGIGSVTNKGGIASIKSGVPHHGAPSHGRFSCPQSKRLMEAENGDARCRMQEVSQEALPQSALEARWNILSRKVHPTHAIRNLLPFPDERMDLFPSAVAMSLIVVTPRYMRTRFRSINSCFCRPRVIVRSINRESPSRLMCGTRLSLRLKEKLWSPQNVRTPKIQQSVR
jgi:hypothetical protein